MQPPPAAPAKSDRQELAPHYLLLASLGLTVAAIGGFVFKGLPLLLALPLGLLIGRATAFRDQSDDRAPHCRSREFPDAIELLVRGLRSGLPIARRSRRRQEVDGPVGVEFRSITDKMKIGRTMDVGAAGDRGPARHARNPVFVITIAIQRETGGTWLKRSRTLPMCCACAADETQDQGDVVQIQGLGLYRRGPSLSSCSD